METKIEEIVIYGLAALLCLVVVWIYIWKQRRNSRIVEEKILKAKEDGLHEPVSLHPVVDINSCIQTGACIAACPEKDILGIRNGKATPINTSRCIGHGACFAACPTQAITLCIGTEVRGVELPHVKPDFESNIPGIYIAGELGGMGLIRNAVEQGRQAVDNLVRSGRRSRESEYDLVVVGAGPAGISATLNAKKHNLRFLTLEQDTLGGTVFSFPRSKIVMTSAMQLPLHGKVKLFETSKKELLDLWEDVLKKNDITIRECTKVSAVVREGDHFRVETQSGQSHTTANVLLAIGRRGTPRKLGVPGESLEKVAYRLIEPERISGKKIAVIGGGDSAVEAAMLLHCDNEVTLSYRGDAFSRIKAKNLERVTKAAEQGQINLKLLSNVVSIQEGSVTISHNGTESVLQNDLIYVFAGGELPSQFLMNAGIEVTKKFGEAILKHK
jgi:thioredoxin reductase/Pyruvate/2-oxoacid:ferredoxin oxidoreductase delta subunit